MQSVCQASHDFMLVLDTALGTHLPTSYAAGEVWDPQAWWSCILQDYLPTDFGGVEGGIEALRQISLPRWLSAFARQHTLPPPPVEITALLGMFY